jgi:Sulfotransferase family
MPNLLDAQSILGRAATRLGLEPYVTEDVSRRFTAFVGLFNAFGAIEAADYPRAAEQMESFVGKRLQLERDWSRHPEILGQSVQSPFFVIGHPRSGTTILQCLLALAAGHRMPRYWEARQPSPPPGMDPSADASAMAAETRHVEELLRMAPRLLSAHPYLDQGALSEAECEDLMTLDFHFLHTLHFTRVPSLPYPIEAADGIAAFTFHKRLLQQFQWKTPTGRWVCKGTLHMYKLPALWKIYPDATCFWTHRSPEDYFASFFAMMEALYRPVNRNLYRPPDASGVIAHMQMAYDQMLRSDWIDDPRVCHIRFTDLIRDPVGILRSSYASRGIAFTSACEAAIRNWMANPAHRADRHGKFQYSLEQFGLSAQKIRAAFAGYYERFNL